MGNRIAKQIREAIKENVNGRGPAVIGTDSNTVQRRIIDCRVVYGTVEGKALTSGKWFVLAGWREA